MKIEDSKGTGLGAAVNAENRLSTSAITETESDHNCDLGNKFNLNTGDISLTGSNKTTVFYVKNNDDNNLFLTALIYNLGNTASGTGDVVMDVIRNPTAGAIITNANNCEMIVNQNHGNSKTFTGLAYKGAYGEVVISDGDKSISTRSAANTGRIFISLGALIIPKGGSLSIDYTPPASNTAQIIQVAATCFFQSVAV